MSEGKSMDGEVGSLPEHINPSTFPAKLWRLINDPANTSICWDPLGETILINQELFKSQVLARRSPDSDNTDLFKTSKFCSFVRQLNLYGFKKNSRTIRVTPPFENTTYHCFYHKNFNRNHPELVAQLKRLTADNKAKLSAGLKVSHRPWSRLGKNSDGSESAVAKHMTPTGSAHNATQLYPLYLLSGAGNGSAPPHRPIPSNHHHHHVGAAPGSNALYMKQSLQPYANHGSPSYPGSETSAAQNQHGLCSPYFQFYPANLVASHLTGNGLQIRPFSPYHYYQIAEKLMPLPSVNCPVKTECPETSGPEFPCNIQESTMDPNNPPNNSSEVFTDVPRMTECPDAKVEDICFDLSVAPKGNMFPGYFG